MWGGRGVNIGVVYGAYRSLPLPLSVQNSGIISSLDSRCFGMTIILDHTFGLVAQHCREISHESNIKMADATSPLCHLPSNA